ncbi:MAG: pilus (MSHA type) biogenesis protein MshL [Sulfuritalea sp.]|nr:pilus (MSHA type) biogenesis protein MshL [Sulfuritalea sp.]MDP1980984.1 pilus (MSHA type) biogenesis protein MshL [Sulfuritalea sp.]
MIPPFPVALAASLMFSACASIQPPAPSAGHINAEAQVAPNPDIPPPVAATVMLARPKAAAKAESYSVSVRNIPVQDLLFALARDAKVNVDIHPGINGIVTINAIDQTLQQILTRIGKQVDMRWELDGPNLVVMQDSPFLRNYKVDYVNMSRDVSGSVSINTQIASTSTSATGGATGGGGGNNSSTSVTSTAKNNFWLSLERNLKDVLRESDKILPEGSSETVIERSDQQATTGTGAQNTSSSRSGSTTTTLAGSPNAASLQQQGTTVVKRTTFREAASIIVNPEAGIVVVRATSKQHEKVQEYLDLALTSARRQVMIEATIAQVALSDTYTQGINWQSLRTLRTENNPRAGFSMIQNPSGPTLGSTGAGFLLNYVAPGLGISATLQLLENFGNVKVLSSPKISVLNNQTAMLKVVNNIVYFSIKSEQATSATGQNPPAPTLTATPQSVAVGLVMSVTPQISESGSILLNVRPSISRVLVYKDDPTNAANKVPEIQTREMESMLRLTDGEIAVMGGLMSDELSNNTDAVPGLSRLPGIGTLFTSRNDVTTKTELVIFLKPTIIRDPSINGDYRSFVNQLPGKDFFTNNPGPEPKQIQMQGAGSQ